MNASELRKIALDVQKQDYLKHYNDTIYRIDEIIENRAKCGWTFLLLVWTGKDYIHNNQLFRWIDREMFKDLKKYYQEKGFRFNKGFFNKDIYIAW